MKLAFPNGEHNDVPIGKGSISIGSSDDDDIVIKSDGVQPGHAVIIVDKRGITLSIETLGDHIRVNDRPVQEKAILRMGDSVFVQDVQMLLRGDESRLQSPPTDAGLADDGAVSETKPPKYLLRGLSGQFVGRMLPIHSRVVLGQADSCDLNLPGDGIADEHIAIESTTAGILLRKLQCENGTLVNGISVEETVLHAGDQISFGDERFMIEAPNFVPGKMFVQAEEETEGSNTQVFSALDLSKQETPSKSKESEAEPEAATSNGQSDNRTRDTIIIGVCLALSVFMLVWLYMNI